MYFIKFLVFSMIALYVFARLILRYLHFLFFIPLLFSFSIYELHSIFEFIESLFKCVQSAI